MALRSWLCVSAICLITAGLIANYFIEGGIAAVPKRLCMLDSRRTVVIHRSQEAWNVPPEVNSFFACDDINSIRENEGPHYYQILYQQEPWTGFVLIRGQSFSCADIYGRTQKIQVGDFRPGEIKKIYFTQSNR